VEKTWRFIRWRENYNIVVVRILGVDVGRRRIGLAISDCSQTLARALATLTLDAAAGKHAEHAADRVAVEVARLEAEDDGLGAIVVGMPVRLDGSPNDETPYVIAFIAALRTRTAIPVVTEGERLTSREAESQLARTERDWRKRKAQLDAAAAAIILQDYLDRPANSGGGAGRERN
jgi:putative Holliday junction resolvase